MGRPVTRWQIITKNPDKLTEFYTRLFQWEANANNALGYRMIDTASETGIPGGIWPAPPEAPTFVQLFVEVDDVAATAAETQRLGGSILMPAQQLPDGETMAILRDPEGMSFGVYSAAAE